MGVSHLTSLTKLYQGVPSGHVAAEGQECLVDVIALFVPDSRFTLLEELGEGLFNAATVFFQSFFMDSLSFCNPRNNPIGSQGDVILFLGVINLI